MVADPKMLYRYVEMLSGQARAVRPQLQQVLASVPKEVRDTVCATDQEWSLLLLDIESHWSAHTLAMMLLEYLMRKEEDQEHVPE